MTVPSTRDADEPARSADVLDRLTAMLADLTPELRKAATYLLENAGEVAFSSSREFAAAADVKPNTLVRLARALGFAGYEEFRALFREDLRRGRENFPDRARWLQSLAKGGDLAGLYAQMASQSIASLEQLYSQCDADTLKAAAKAIIAAHRTYILGVGIAYPPARNFAYLASMAGETVSAIPRDGSLPVDALVRSGAGDILIAMTFKPYRRDVVDTVRQAQIQGMGTIAISDSPASPILVNADHKFVVPVETPQFFTSTVALSAFLETLIAFVIADADTEVIANIERFHRRRQELGIYWSEEDWRS